MQFKVWLEEKELFLKAKQDLRNEILATLDPNQDYHHVLATRLSNYKDSRGIQAGPNQVIKVFDGNSKIWELMNQAFPGEVNKANQIRDWLKSAGPNDTVNDLMQQIGISGDPIVLNRAIKSRHDKMPTPQGKTAPPIKQQAPVRGQIPSPIAQVPA